VLLQQICFPVKKDTPEWLRSLMFNLSCMAGILESRFLKAKRKIGGRTHPKLNICLAPMVNKNHEGNVNKDIEKKVKST